MHSGRVDKTHQVAKTHQFVKQLWEGVEVKFPYWHGWGYRKAESGTELVIYVEPGADHKKLLRASEFISRQLPLKVVQLNRFLRAREIHICRHEMSLRPGSGVYSVSVNGDCRPFPGTVGAFLRTRGTKGPVWLLSNHHVLVSNENCLPVNVFSESGVLISKSVLPVPLGLHGNRVDAALAELIDPELAKPLYHPLELASTAPAKIAEGDAVQKLGLATNLTTGRVLHTRCTMRILDCDESNNREFVDQIMIESIPGSPGFVSKRDSGALVIAGKQPAALLFAVANAETPGAAIGLATPWQNVLDEVAKIIPPPVELLALPGRKSGNSGYGPDTQLLPVA
jgi:hypothetical protein